MRIVGLMCAAAVCFVVASCATEPPPATGPKNLSPADTVRAYHAALAKNECAQVEAMLTAQSAAITKAVIGNSFQAFCDHPWMGPYTGLKVERVEITDEFEHKPSGIWTVSAVLYFTEGKIKEETVRLVREAGAWKIMLPE